ncbi:MAG TPA: RNA 2',3'-cyclic phosphodiesterase [Solirubrobacteraceae bacterium]|jgi:2'-5' RNA ligase|nr:RNA 2',3'-cyclic phosphodiesterase [Solirubrobacteraceae bacterium]
MGGHPTARLFAAIDPPGAVCEQLAAWAREVAGAIRAQAGPAGVGEDFKVRLLAPETMHVTLCFLGGRLPEEMQTLGAALEALDGSIGELSLGAPLWLPPRAPRTLALEIGDEDGSLTDVQARLSEAFAQAVDWQPERRRFRAHLTVARLGRGKPSRRTRGERPGRQRRGAEEGAGPPLLPPTPQLSFRPTSVVLYRSWLDSQGARYEPIATRALDAP